MNKILGIDIGSISVDVAVLAGDGSVVEVAPYRRHLGKPLETLLQVLKRDVATPLGEVRCAAVTGLGARAVAEALGAEFVNEVIAQAKATGKLYPQVRTIIEIGGEDSKLILLGHDEKLGGVVIDDFSMNTICAAGTGSFLDQQATRLGLTIEQFAEMSLKSKKPPRIAGRCSVFAKSDMIHLQQEATADYDIVAGLCYALARNFRSTIGKGKEITKPVSFQGGVAANAGMVRAFRDVLGLADEELVIPVYYASMGAIGAALVALERKTPGGFRGIQALEELVTRPPAEEEALKRLEIKLSVINPASQSYLGTDGMGRVNVYLGIDVGSISTNVVAIDEKKRLVSRQYLMTAGRPIEAVRRGVALVGDEIGDRVTVCGVGTTGSGRYLIGDFVGGDLVKNEITAQARASVEIDPTVDTIFEIGGQDSKFISIENGAIVDFEMNKVCAAGTGSFLEEQAERLGIKIKEEFGALALAAKKPVSLGERCTVFMESNLVHHQQRGAERENLVGGLSYSIVTNYLNRVVAGKKIGSNIFFQGAVAFNKGVVAAFEQVLGKRITVPPNNDVTGAIGVALLAMEERKWECSRFKGFKEVESCHYELESFECGKCPNMCEVRKVLIEGEKPLFYGSRCERYDVDRKRRVPEGLPDLFAEREKLLLASHKPAEQAGAPRIGFPRALIFHELYPFWNAFFSELGYEVVLSDRSNRKIIDQGLENVVAETCFPIKVLHGHVLDLLEKKVDMLFLPSFINMPQPNPRFAGSYCCPYVQTAPYVTSSALDLHRRGLKVLIPHIYAGRTRENMAEVLFGLGRELGKSRALVKSAWGVAREAQGEFYAAVAGRGREVLDSLPEDAVALVIVSRPYNGCDPGINLDLPSKLRDQGVLAVPMDFLPLDSVDISDEWPNMYWRYGQKILAAGEFVRKDPRLWAVYITNFGCGPDSFILRFFRRQMDPKPFLQIEVDEHSADVGAITRCEAFADSLKNVRKRQYEASHRRTRTSESPRGVQDRMIYIPYMGDVAYALRSAFRAYGYLSEVMPPSDEETLRCGRRHTSGKECYPCIITTGDMVKMVTQKDFDRTRTAFFMGKAPGPCRFGQYHKLHLMVLDELGFSDVPVVSLDNRDSYSGMGSGFTSLAWQGIVAVDVLEKAARKLRPYEHRAGEVEETYQRSLARMCEALEKKKDLLEPMNEAAQAFAKIPVGSDSRPLIGIVGEIFVRSHRFSNDDLVRRIEMLGGEVWLAPVEEWFAYVNYKRQMDGWASKRFRSFLKRRIQGAVQRHHEHRLGKPFEELFAGRDETFVGDIVEMGRPYLDPSYEGEAILSVGKAIDFAKRGLAGIINAMPFTCLPGTIVAAVSKRIRNDFDNIPWLNMAYDGLGSSNAETRLEAFVYQTDQYQKRRARAGSQAAGSDMHRDRVCREHEASDCKAGRDR